MWNRKLCRIIRKELDAKNTTDWYHCVKSSQSILGKDDWDWIMGGVIGDNVAKAVYTAMRELCKIE